MSEPKGVEAFHQLELNAGHFLIQRCTDCTGHVYFPREVCPHCGGTSLEWIAPKGTGTVYAVTTVRRKAGDGGDINVSLVDLDEGVRLMSRIDSPVSNATKIGQRVKSRVQVNDGKGLVVFDAMQGGAL
ncbi:Zn-ribbon domain-containing OB-fold protein [Bradyrhizobium murdochi]|uniref:Zn-ribbon domain-containing OB-fold protein n=1 Tax=Bradyrhizobium murdochi TaxID=1038859 RepID=UPI00041A7A43|nr:OB-fold domain-containing protein [Bradyrhizobium murdochi]